MQENVLTIFAAGTQLDDISLNFPMEQYIYQRKRDGIYIKFLRRMWEELMLATTAIVATEGVAAL